MRTNCWRFVLPALVLAAGLVSLCWVGLQQASAAKDAYVIGAVFDVTGTGAPLGTPEHDTVQMLAKQINARGGINGHPLRVVFYDNGSDPSNSVRVVKKLIESDKVLAIIGPSQTGTTLAAADTISTAKIPMVSCAAGIKIVDPVKPWIFKTAQSDVHAVAKVIDYLKAHNIKKVAVISVSNPFGDSGKQQLELQAPKQGISIVAKESFGDTDADMTAQLIRIRKSKAQAVICWGTNPGPANVAKNLKNLGIKLPLIMSHGVANKQFITLAGPAANGVIFPAGKLLVANSLPGSEKQKKVLLAYAGAFQKEYNRSADTFGGHAYDAFNLVVNALKVAGPNPAKIRQALEKSKGYVGISGVFNFTPADHNGLAKDAFVMVQIVNGKWVPVK
ncbi:MAG TPA: ABC transporter substrate-binding protein [Armatimonadota bacterium]